MSEHATPIASPRRGHDVASAGTSDNAVRLIDGAGRRTHAGHDGRIDVSREPGAGSSCPMAGPFAPSPTAAT